MSLLLVFRPIDRPMFASARSANSISRLSDDMHGADTRTNANAAAMFLNVPRVAKRGLGLLAGGCCRLDRLAEHHSSWGCRGLSLVGGAYY